MAPGLVWGRLQWYSCVSTPPISYRWGFRKRDRTVISLGQPVTCDRQTDLIPHIPVDQRPRLREDTSRPSVHGICTAPRIAPHPSELLVLCAILAHVKREVRDALRAERIDLGRLALMRSVCAIVYAEEDERGESVR